MKKFGLWIYEAYQYIFDSSKNPLRHIPDPTSRMFIMTILAFMWSGVFAVYLGSIIYFGISVAAQEYFEIATAAVDSVFAWIGESGVELKQAGTGNADVRPSGQLQRV